MILIVTISLVLGLSVGGAAAGIAGLYLGSASGCPYCREKFGLK